MLQIFKKKYFVFPFIIWLVLGAIFLLKINKGDLVLFFNSNRTLYGNIYFLITNKLAEWQFILFLAAFLAYKKFGDSFLILFTWAMTGIFAQIFKIIFDMPRPKAFFNDKTLNFITENQYTHHSFPSGHTTTAFAIFFVLALITNKKYLQLTFFIFALSVAFARVYLLQHFFIDVYFGSILGFFIGYFVFVSINKSNIFDFQKWKNKRIGKKTRF